MPTENYYVKDTASVHHYTKTEAAIETAEGTRLRCPHYLEVRIKEAKASIRLVNRQLKGKFYPGSPGRIISSREQEFYASKLEDHQQKLDLYQHYMKTLKT